MAALPLLDELRAAGFVLAVEGEADIRIAPASRLTPELRDRIRAHKPELLRVLRSAARPDGQPDSGRSDIDAMRWRVEVLRPQVPRTGPIPFLVVRHGAVRAPGRCLSCGDAMEPGHVYRCAACATAVDQVLAEVRESVRHASDK
jgi:hypothetical protein